MKLSELRAFAARLRAFDHIVKARRIEENVIEMTFSDAARERSTYHFDMTRGRSEIRKAPAPVRPMQDFAAPFDTLLHQLCTNASLLHTHIVGDDRILRLSVAPKSAYKDRTVSVQFEFTGKNTNVILLDEEEHVIEALRHIGADRSFRVVKPGAPLLALPSRASKPSEESVSPDTIDKLLQTRYEAHRTETLTRLKKQKTAQIEKKIAKIDALLRHLPDEDSLRSEAQKLRQEANIVLAHLYRIKPYDKQLHAHDFEGNAVTIDLPRNVPVNRMSEHLFNLAKKYEKKIEHIHIERQNLLSKKRFYENTRYALANASDPAELEMLVPKRGRAKRKKEKQRIGELYWIEGYKVMVGRNAKENQALLELARANDIWMHVRGIPGSHVIIRTDKQNLPESLLQAAAKLCVDFSTDKPGNYEVDYTKRKFVKSVEGSHVVYDKYKTIHVLKEGVEIRI
jgi:predicted ribosome quality control (RQC) complex YloA/Tae2 family protein